MRNIAIFSVIGVLLVAGCTGQTLNPAELAKTSATVKQFLADYPRATIVASLVSNTTLPSECDLSESSKDYWKVTINDPDSNSTMVTWIESESQKVVCAVKTGGPAKEDEKEDKEHKNKDSEDTTPTGAVIVVPDTPSDAEETTDNEQEQPIEPAPAPEPTPAPTPSVTIPTEQPPAQNVNVNENSYLNDNCFSIVNFHWNAADNDNYNKNDEYVIIKNTCTYEINMNSWRVEDESTRNVYRFGDFTLSSGSIFTLFTGCGTNTATELYWCSSPYAVWNNDGDTLFLIDDLYNLVFSESYVGY